MVRGRLTRREVLTLSGIALVGLAGCSTRATDPDDRNTSTVTERQYSHSIDTPDSIRVRNPEGKPAIRSSAHSPEENVSESSASWDYEDWIVTSPSERNALNFPQAANGAEAARDFIAATDLSEETLLVHQYNIDECETRQLDRLKWSNDVSCGDVECVGLYLTYEPTERDSDCQDNDSDDSDSPPDREDSHDSETTFIRIPTQIQSYGSFSVQV